MGVQVREPGGAADGAFLGFNEQYILSDTTASIRSGAYAIPALLRYAGVRDRRYFFADDEHAPD